MKQNACNLNIQTYSLEEMLEEWKTRKMLLPGRRDCTAERDDGIDLDAVLVREIEAAYDRLLREAPTEWLRGGVNAPVCVAGNRRLYLYSVGNHEEIRAERVLAVEPPEKGWFAFADAAWDFLLSETTSTKTTY